MTGGHEVKKRNYWGEDEARKRQARALYRKREEKKGAKKRKKALAQKTVGEEERRRVERKKHTRPRNKKTRRRQQVGRKRPFPGRGKRTKRRRRKRTEDKAKEAVTHANDAGTLMFSFKTARGASINHSMTRRVYVHHVNAAMQTE